VKRENTLISYVKLHGFMEKVGEACFVTVRNKMYKTKETKMHLEQA
jgi:hypothetical protein